MTPKGHAIPSKTQLLSYGTPAFAGGILYGGVKRRRGDGFMWAAGGFAAHTPSFSRAASFRQVQNTAMACSSSATGGREGAMRMLLSWGSLP